MDSQRIDSMKWPPTILEEEVTDPAAIARCQAQCARHRRNSDWLQANWNQLLPQETTL